MLIITRVVSFIPGGNSSQSPSVTNSLPGGVAAGANGGSNKQLINPSQLTYDYNNSSPKFPETGFKKKELHKIQVFTPLAQKNIAASSSVAGTSTQESRKTVSSQIIKETKIGFNWWLILLIILLLIAYWLYKKKEYK